MFARCPLFPRKRTWAERFEMSGKGHKTSFDSILSSGRSRMRPLAAATATVWPLAAIAQRSSTMRRIAVVVGLTPDDVEAAARSAAFEQALAALGWTKGGTIAIDYNWYGMIPRWRKKRQMRYLKQDFATTSAK